MKLASWVAGVYGRPVDHDHAYGPQCVDLVNDWAERGRGAPTFVGATAARLVPARPGRWAWEANGPSNAPLPGDVVIWGADLRAGTGIAGHCAVALVADDAYLVTLDQNWGGVAAPRAVVHHYAGVQGWYRAVP